MFRLKHIPTGLYFQPARSILVEKKWKLKSNLSKRGKVYTTRPSFKYIGDQFYSHLSYRMTNKWLSPLPEHVMVQFIDSEWVIEEVKNA